MDIFNIFTMLGGLALFLYGMRLMEEGLRASSGGRLETLLEKLTSNTIKGVALGAGVTAVIQSSSATTVMVVGFVNSGIMQLQQTVGVIMGANIGTTVTSWILSLTGIEGDSMLVRMLEPSSFAPLLALIGVILLMTQKKEKTVCIGTIMLGFAVLMIGMGTMSDAVAPLAQIPQFTSLMVKFSHPILGMLAGTILTAIIQSSSASVGILQALCLTGAVGYQSAIPIIMGQNIGTCITAIIASIGANKNAKRVACIHLSFNVIGTILFMLCFYGINYWMPFAFLTEAATPVGIAVIHSAFNIASTIVLLPFSKGLVKLSMLILPEDKNTAMVTGYMQRLDERFLDNTEYALDQAQVVRNHMLQELAEAVAVAYGLVKQYDKQQLQIIKEREQNLSMNGIKLNDYIVAISQSTSGILDAQRVNGLLQDTQHMERMLHHIREIARTAKALKEDGKLLTEEEYEDINVVHKMVDESLHILLPKTQVGYEECVQQMQRQYREFRRKEKQCRKHYLARMKKKKTSSKGGILYWSILSESRDIMEHCRSMAGIR